MECNKFADIAVCLPNYSLVSILMAFYSYVPLLLFPVFIFWLCTQRTTRSALVLLIFAVAILINEGILKHTIRQPRPAGSCACTYGMPSGHSLLSFLYMTWIILECLLCISMWSIRKRVTYITLSIILFAPVPYSRVYLLYHTPAQAVVGLSLGFIFAVVYFLVLRLYLIHKLPIICRWRYIKKLKNTYVQLVSGDEEKMQERSFTKAYFGVYE